MFFSTMYTNKWPKSIYIACKLGTVLTMYVVIKRFLCATLVKPLLVLVSMLHPTNVDLKHLQLSKMVITQYLNDYLRGLHRVVPEFFPCL